MRFARVVASARHPSLWIQKFGLVGAVLGATALLWGGASAPLVHRWLDRSEQVRQMERVWRQSQRLLSRQPELEALSNALVQRWGIDPNDRDAGGTIRAVEATAGRCGVTVLGIQPNEGRREGLLEVSAVEFECQGTPGGIARLLHELQGGRPPATVQRLRLTTQPSTPNAVTARLTLEQAGIPAASEAP